VVSRLGQPKELDRIPCPDLIALLWRDVSVDLFDRRSAVRPFTLNVRKVCGEHNLANAQMVT
jgi:hypothetical protein